MTEEDRLLLVDLKANAQQLFQEFNRLENEKKELQEIVAGLKKELDKLRQVKIELGRKQERLEVANTILSGKDENKLARQRINRIVREIDKCIALLNR